MDKNTIETFNTQHEATAAEAVAKAIKILREHSEIVTTQKTPTFILSYETADDFTTVGAGSIDTHRELLHAATQGYGAALAAYGRHDLSSPEQFIHGVLSVLGGFLKERTALGEAEMVANFLADVPEVLRKIASQEDDEAPSPGDSIH